MLKWARYRVISIKEHIRTQNIVWPANVAFCSNLKSIRVCRHRTCHNIWRNEVGATRRRRDKMQKYCRHESTARTAHTYIEHCILITVEFRHLSRLRAQSFRNCRTCQYH